MKPFIFVIFQGGGVRTPAPSSPSGPVLQVHAPLINTDADVFGDALYTEGKKV